MRKIQLTLKGLKKIKIIFTNIKILMNSIINIIYNKDGRKSLSIINILKLQVNNYIKDQTVSNSYKKI